MSVPRVVGIVEGLLGVGILRLTFGWRSEFVWLLLTLALLMVLHMVVQGHLLPRLERYFAPVGYDERRILFELGQEARRATDVEDLFRLVGDGSSPTCLRSGRAAVDGV